jgi:murein DD-endopeptidase MepM/ murein hydrolase activator NlpD
MAHYVITSGVGYRTNPMGGGEQSFHRGIDMVGPHGSAILAAGDGVVVEHWPPPGTFGPGGHAFRGHPTFGGLIVIDHGNGVWTLYGHMSRTFVREGQRVRAGEIIGIQGRTGDATGEHLHFEVVIDPRLLFDPPGITGPTLIDLRQLLK